MKKIIIGALLCISSLAVGQDKIEITESDYNNNEVEMADALRANGKIYVVVGVVTVILLALIGYTTSVDRKVSKLEKLINKDDENHDG